jgi:hypothetical protein
LFEYKLLSLCSLIGFDNFLCSLLCNRVVSSEEQRRGSLLCQCHLRRFSLLPLVFLRWGHGFLQFLNFGLPLHKFSSLIDPRPNLHVVHLDFVPCFIDVFRLSQNPPGFAVIAVLYLSLLQYRQDLSRCPDENDGERGEEVQP